MNDFNPDWASPPGDTISTILEERGISVTTFAKMLRKSVKLVRRLLKGNEPITNELANELEKLLGAPARFWLARESRYRKDLVRLGKIK